MDYRDETPMTYSARDQAAPVNEGLRAYMLSIYNYMTSALCLTGIFAYLAANWAPLSNALFNMDGIHPGLTGLGFVVLFAPLIMVFAFGAAIRRLSLSGAATFFFAYSAIMGMSLAPIFFVYTGASIVRVFFITAIVFGSMSIWGYSTKRDLTGMGHFMYMGLWGIIIASVVNMFMGSSALQFAISVLGVGIFTGLTAWDTQKLKALYYQMGGRDAETSGKYAIMGALQLYLDFINMFMMLLRLMGDRR